MHPPLGPKKSTVHRWQHLEVSVSLKRRGCEFESGCSNRVVGAPWLSGFIIELL